MTGQSSDTTESTNHLLTDEMCVCVFVIFGKTQIKCFHSTVPSPTIVHQIKMVRGETALPDRQANPPHSVHAPVTYFISGSFSASRFVT